MQGGLGASGHTQGWQREQRSQIWLSHPCLCSFLQSSLPRTLGRQSWNGTCAQRPPLPGHPLPSTSSREKPPPSLPCPAPGFPAFPDPAVASAPWFLPSLGLWVTVWLPQEADRQQGSEVGKSCVFMFCVCQAFLRGPREDDKPTTSWDRGPQRARPLVGYLAAPLGPGEHVSQRNGSARTEKGGDGVAD